MKSVDALVVVLQVNATETRTHIVMLEADYLSDQEVANNVAQTFHAGLVAFTHVPRSCVHSFEGMAYTRKQNTTCLCCGREGHDSSELHLFERRF